MASKVIGTERTEDGVIVVTVRHLDTDSFSRSVDRAARKAWRTFDRPTQQATRHTGANYACECQGRECVSKVGFGPSFDAVYRAVGREDLVGA